MTLNRRRHPIADLIPHPIGIGAPEASPSRSIMDLMAEIGRPRRCGKLRQIFVAILDLAIFRSKDKGDAQ